MPALGLAVALRDSGQHQRAVDMFENAPQVMGGVGSATLATLYPQVGREEEARAILAGFEAASSEDHPFGFLRGSIHVALGEVEPALDAIEKGAGAREATVLSAGVSHGLAPIREEPRLQALLRQMGVGGVNLLPESP